MQVIFLVSFPSLELKQQWTVIIPAKSAPCSLNGQIPNLYHLIYPIQVPYSSSNIHGWYELVGCFNFSLGPFDQLLLYASLILVVILLYKIEIFNIDMDMLNSTYQNVVLTSFSYIKYIVEYFVKSYVIPRLECTFW